jgi:hypothetical protein
MKLLVAAETFMGKAVAQSIASTFKAPPMPGSPDTTPAESITNAPSHHRTP